MAGAPSAASATTTTSFRLPPAASAAPVSKKSVILASSLSSPFPSKRTRRKNHLRQKILKTLENKPYLSEFPLQDPTIPIDDAIQQQSTEIDPFSLSETLGFVDGVFGKFSTKSFLKIGLYLFGALVFQTICAVWIFRTKELHDKDEKLDSDDYSKARVLDLGVNGNSELKSESESESKSLYQNVMKTVEGGIVLVDEPEMEKKIVEIQEMAREARLREKLEAKKKGSGDEGNDDGDHHFVDKTGIEKEVDGRLTKLRKSLESSHEKLPYNFLKKGDVGDEVDKGNSAVKDAFGALMFKKKYEYKSPSIDSRDKPKGFDGTEDHHVANGTLINGLTNDNGTRQSDKTNDNETLSNGISSDNGTLSNGVNSDIGVSILDKGATADLSNGDGLEISANTTQDDNKDQTPVEESKPISEPRNRLGNKSEKAKQRGGKTESNAGTSKKQIYDKETVRAVKSGKTSNTEARKPRGFGKENQSDTAISTKHDGFNRNDSVSGKNGGNRKSASKLGDKKSSTQTDFWWSRLPYVLAVVMRRGGNAEGSEGLFTLRSSLQTKDVLSHTVAFEDRGDATNFCYLLESFFEDLGNFNTDIVPIPINELEEAVKSQIMKVVVVKKGQLQLYAGQPLTDVEMALRSLIDEQSNTP